MNIRKKIFLGTALLSALAYPILHSHNPVNVPKTTAPLQDEKYDSLEECVQRIIEDQNSFRTGEKKTFQEIYQAFETTKIDFLKLTADTARDDPDISYDRSYDGTTSYWLWTNFQKEGNVVSNTTVQINQEVYREYTLSKVITRPRLNRLLDTYPNVVYLLQDNLLLSEILPFGVNSTMSMLEHLDQLVEESSTPLNVINRALQCSEISLDDSEELQGIITSCQEVAKLADTNSKMLDYKNMTLEVPKQLRRKLDIIDARYDNSVHGGFQHTLRLYVYSQWATQNAHEDISTKFSKDYFVEKYILSQHDLVHQVTTKSPLEKVDFALRQHTSSRYVEFLQWLYVMRNTAPSNRRALLDEPIENLHQRICLAIPHNREFARDIRKPREQYDVPNMIRILQKKLSAYATHSIPVPFPPHSILFQVENANSLQQWLGKAPASPKNLVMATILRDGTFPRAYRLTNGAHSFDRLAPLQNLVTRDPHVLPSILQLKNIEGNNDDDCSSLTGYVEISPNLYYSILTPVQQNDTYTLAPQDGTMRETFRVPTVIERSWGDKTLLKANPELPDFPGMGKRVKEWYETVHVQNIPQLVHDAFSGQGVRNSATESLGRILERYKYNVILGPHEERVFHYTPEIQNIVLAVFSGKEVFYDSFVQRDTTTIKEFGQPVMMMAGRKR